MISRITPGFRKRLAALPSEVRRQAHAAYRQFKQNPRHSGLRFQRIQESDHLVSVRISRDYRAVGVRKSADEIVWFWVGPHGDYERLLAKG